MDRPILAAMVSVSGAKLTENEKRLLGKGNPLGVSLFGRNIQNKAQIKNLCSEIKEVIGRDDVLIAVDQEGGRVRRLKEPEFNSSIAQIDFDNIRQKFGEDIAIKMAESHALITAHDLLECGINVNYAPCLDVLHPNTSDVLKSRCFSSDPNFVAKCGQAMIKAYQNAGICPCMKHMPGHGLAHTDPHLGLPIIEETITQLNSEFYPFIYNADAPMAMTAHILLKDVDSSHPVTQSKIAISSLIREKIGFGGFLISDAIDMHALQGSLDEKISLSLKAGCDAVCYCMGNEDDLSQIMNFSYFLTDEALIRFAKIKKIFQNKINRIDITPYLQFYQNHIEKIEPYIDSYDATETLHLMKQKP